MKGMRRYELCFLLATFGRCPRYGRLPIIMFRMRYALGSSSFVCSKSVFHSVLTLFLLSSLTFVRLSAFASALVYCRFEPTSPVISL
jgi:hypothetical protein